MAKINTKNAKLFLTENGVRASKAATIAFQEKLQEACLKLGKACADIAIEKKRKTVLPEDVEAAFSNNLE